MSPQHIENIIRGQLRSVPARLVEDLKQDAWLAVLKAMAEHPAHPEWGSLKNTVCRVVRWKILEGLARGRRRPGLLGDDDVLIADRSRPPPLTVAVSLDAQTQLDRLGAEDRLLIELRFRDDLTNAEIGLRMGKSGEAVRQHIERILESLRYPASDLSADDTDAS